MKDGFVSVAAASPALRVADCMFNAAQIARAVLKASEKSVKLVVFPELSLTGVTCGDLFFQKTLLQGAEDALNWLLEQTSNLDTVFVVGLPVRQQGALYHCSAVCQRGEILGVVPKTGLSAAERRYFAEGPEELTQIGLCGVYPLFGAALTLACETIPELILGVVPGLHISSPAVQNLVSEGVTVLCRPAGECELVGSAAYRRQMLAAETAAVAAACIFANSGAGESTMDQTYGGHDLIVENGTVLAEQRFCEDLLITQIDVQRLEQQRRLNGAGKSVPFSCSSFCLDLEETQLTRSVNPMPFIPEAVEDRPAAFRDILTIAALGLKRRLEHTGAKTAVIGLSGGLDSTLALLIIGDAFDMLGRDRKDILAVTMPCFGTTERTRSNAEVLASCMGCSFRTIPIGDSVRSHFADIGQSMENHDVTFENGQARERTQVLMDLANMTGGLVIGTGDLSELALGWATYNGDHMSMYGVNASIPKTLMRHLVYFVAQQSSDPVLTHVLEDILDTPVSPELLPARDGQIAQKTEDLVGPYELHDFFLYYVLRWAFPPAKIYRLACYAHGEEYGAETILKWLKTFYRRFFTQQFKRNCLPEGPRVGTVSLSPRGGWLMPSDAVRSLWEQELEQLG